MAFPLFSKYPVDPLYPALKRFAFFRGSKLTHRGPKGAVQFGPQSKPCKRQTAPAAGGADGNRSREGDISLNSLTEAPVVFLAFAVGETPAPERSEGKRGGSHAYKGLKKTRAGACWKKDLPCDRLPVDHGFIRIFTLLMPFLLMEQ